MGCLHAQRSIRLKVSRTTATAPQYSPLAFYARYANKSWFDQYFRVVDAQMHHWLALRVGLPVSAFSHILGLLTSSHYPQYITVVLLLASVGLFYADLKRPVRRRERGDEGTHLYGEEEPHPGNG